MSTDLAVAVPRVHGARSEELHLRSQRERFPIAAGLELTHRCNLACVHCYVNLAPNDREAQRSDSPGARSDIMMPVAGNGISAAASP